MAILLYTELSNMGSKRLFTILWKYASRIWPQSGFLKLVLIVHAFIHDIYTCINYFIVHAANLRLCMISLATINFFMLFHPLHDLIVILTLLLYYDLCHFFCRIQESKLTLLLIAMNIRINMILHKVTLG